ncbi:MAG: signal peptide peptidase SppA [Tepidisphaerales bacterium]
MGFPPGPMPMPPMPPMMPPMPMPWMMPPPRGGGLVRGIFVTLALSIFSVSLCINLYFLIAYGFSAAGSAEEQVLERGQSDQRIVVLPVEGLISDARSQQFRRWLDSIGNDTRVKAIVLAIDSPGGAVTPSDEMRQAVADFKQKHSVPVVVTMSGVAASGGYYIATAADYIIAQPTTLTGSIGVRMDRYNVSELAKKWGVAETTITAPENGMKNAGSMFKPEEPQERRYYQGILDDAYTRFVKLVSDSRKNKLKKPVAELCTGEAFTANQALANGLVDEIAYAPAAYAKAAKMAGLSQPTVVRLQARKAFPELFLGDSGEGRAGVNIRIDREVIDDLQRPRLMYLWRGD